MKAIIPLLAFGAALALGAPAVSAAPADPPARGTDRLFSPAIGRNGSQFLICDVVNTDDQAHTVDIRFFDSTGAQVSGNPPLQVPPHGFQGISIGPGTASHCEIILDANARLFRGSISVLDPATGSAVVALPIPQ